MRLLTRSDFDGLACAVLFKELGLLDEWKFVHPKDVQDGKICVTENDILANVPFAPGAGMWFDHHASEQERLDFEFEFRGASQPEKSAARVVWRFFGGESKFGDKYDEMLEFVDRVDSGELTNDEVLNPDGWVLLGYLMDPRTGLGRYHDYRISNYQLMEDLIDHCRDKSIAEILALPDVQQRIARYRKQEPLFKQMIEQNTTLRGNVLVLDLRQQEEIFTGNRFLMYAMYPQVNVSIQIIWGLKKMNTVFTVGYSVLNRTCGVNVGSLMLKYGGGGHHQVGTCQVPNDQAEEALEEIVKALSD